MRYVEPGSLVTMRGSNSVAQAYEAGSGNSAKLSVWSLRASTASGDEWAPFSTSAKGVLAYRAQTDSGIARLNWVDRSGRVLGQVGEAADFSNPALSPMASA